mmetsp:Transcript_9714/g.21071  ORF Transcript_9714/g.21071 Transcript_9714/m.21071 type:complete len:686 (-) Transcript_9714:129-2186(-)
MKSNNEQTVTPNDFGIPVVSVPEHTSSSRAERDNRGSTRLSVGDGGLEPGDHDSRGEIESGGGHEGRSPYLSTVASVSELGACDGGSFEIDTLEGGEGGFTSRGGRGVDDHDEDSRDGGCYDQHSPNDSYLAFLNFLAGSPLTDDVDIFAEDTVRDLEEGAANLNRTGTMEGSETPPLLDLSAAWNDDFDEEKQNLDIPDEDNNEAPVHSSQIATDFEGDFAFKEVNRQKKKLAVPEDNIEVPTHPTHLAAELGDEIISEQGAEKNDRDQIIQCNNSIQSEEDGARSTQDTVSSPADDPDPSHNQGGVANRPAMVDAGMDSEEDLQGDIEPTIMPPPPSMLPQTQTFSEPSIRRSVPIIEGQLVEQEPEPPLYDGVPVEEEHWMKKHLRPIAVIVGLTLIIAIMAVALGLGSVNNDDTEAANISVKIPPQPTTFTSPLMTFPPTMTSLAHPSSPSSISVSPSMNLSPTSLTFPPFPPTIPQSTTPSFQPNEQPSLGPSEGPSSYSHRCFVDRTELKAAVDAYIAGGLDCSEENNCQVTQEYGWPIGTWCVSNITDMHALFERKYFFNEDISLWNTSAVVDMSSMFHRATAFNGDLSSWDTSEVANMRKMFNRADVFNGDVSNWDTSSVEDMTLMFRHATLFNQNLCAWGNSFLYGDAEDIFLDSGCIFQNTPQRNKEGPFCASRC